MSFRRQAQVVVDTTGYPDGALVGFNAATGRLGPRRQPVVNVRDYGAAGDGVTDDSAAFAAAFAAADATGNREVFAEGAFLLNQTTYLASNNADTSYRLRGAGGMATKIVLGPGLAGKFAFEVNRTSGGVTVLDGTSHPRFIAQDLYVTGRPNTTSQQSFLKLWGKNGAGCSAVIERVVFDFVYLGVTFSGYSDQMTFRNIHWRNHQSGGWLYLQNNNGDGLVMENVFIGSSPNGYNGISLKYNLGATLTGLIGGNHYVESSQGVNVIGAHVETVETGGAPFTIRDSHVTFRGCFIGQVARNLTTPPAGMVIVDDQVAYRPQSCVTFDGCRFYFTTPPNGTTAMSRIPDVYLSAASKLTRVRLRGCDLTFFLPSRQITETYGVVMRSADGTVDSALTGPAAAHLSGDVELIYRNGAWALSPLAPTRDLSTSRSDAGSTYVSGWTALTQSYAPGSQGAGTFYYRVQVTDPNGFVSTAPAETSVVLSAGQCAVTVIAPSQTPCVLRVWRGTTPGTYDRYVDIPMASTSVELYDQGATVSGHAWITTGVPAVATASTPLDGIVLAGRRQVWATAAPTTGAWAQGAVVYNSAAAASGFIGWVCTSAGTPGTWKTFGAISP